MHVAAGLDLVAVRIADEGAIIVGVIFRPQAWLAVFDAALLQR
jgi:hypothetical protein